MHFEIGSDHRGFELKRRILSWLSERGHSTADRGCDRPESCDYPDFAYRVAREVAARLDAQGILICSNGIGMSMAANKVPGVRAALCVTPAMASQARRHNDANVLVLGADNASAEESLRILEAWMDASFEGGRHERRVRKLAAGEGGGRSEAASGAGPGAAAERAAAAGGAVPADEACIFCRIVAGRIPAERVYADERLLAVRDIHPAAPTHLLLIPKAHIPTLADLLPEHEGLMGGLVLAAARIARAEGLARGYRLVANCGREAGQEVTHIHFHLLGGRPLGWPPG